VRPPLDVVWSMCTPLKRILKYWNKDAQEAQTDAEKQKLFMKSTIALMKQPAMARYPVVFTKLEIPSTSGPTMVSTDFVFGVTDRNPGKRIRVSNTERNHIKEEYTLQKRFRK
jgi:hypothetical protein